MSNLIPKIGWMLFMFFLCVFAVIWYVYQQILEALKPTKRPVREDSFEQPRTPWTYENMKHGKVKKNE